MMADEEKSPDSASETTQNAENTTTNKAATAEQELPQVASNGLAELKALQEARHRHAQRYKEREEAAQKAEEEAAAEAERKKQQEEEEERKRKVEEEEREARQRQLEADEEYARQFAAQLNPGMDRQLQEMRNGAPVEVPLDDSDGDFASSYHQMEDADGYRAPMRTGYTDRLIDPPAMDFASALPFPPLLAAEGRLSVADGDSARDLELQDSRARPQSTSLAGQLVPLVLGFLLLTGLLAYMKAHGAHDYDVPDGP